MRARTHTHTHTHTPGPGTVGDRTRWRCSVAATVAFHSPSRPALCCMHHTTSRITHRISPCMITQHTKMHLCHHHMTVAGHHCQSAELTDLRRARSALQLCNSAISLSKCNGGGRWTRTDFMRTNVLARSHTSHRPARTKCMRIDRHVRVSLEASNFEREEGRCGQVLEHSHLRSAGRCRGFIILQKKFKWIKKNLK